MGHEALEAEKKYPSGWKIGSLRCKNSQALLFLERIFLFLDLDCQNLATLGFDNCPISEKKNSLSEKKLRLRVFPSQSKLFPAARNYSRTSQDMDGTLTLIFGKSESSRNIKKW